MENLGLSSKFWTGKRVFLTGHTGFKGSWFSLWLHSMGAEVIGFALQPSSKPNLFELANIKNNIISIIGDIRDFEQIKKAVYYAKPEIVIHMAAQPLVRYSYQNPLETYATNVMGTCYLLESLREINGVKAILNVTSDKCYENHEQNKAYSEGDPMGGYDPYSSSKGCAELVTSSYRSSFFNVNQYKTHGIALASARTGNVIGGGDWSNDRLIPDFIRALDENKPLMIRNPNAIRPWQHVLEPLAGYLTLSERLYNKGYEFAEAWNFGPDESDAQTVKSIADLFACNWSDEAKVEVTEGNELYEANYLRLDSSKAKTKLHWRPKININESIKMTCDWYKAFYKNEDMNSYTLKQIAAYLKKS